MHNAAMEVRSGILTQPGQYPSENVKKPRTAALKLFFDCCVLCMENSKEVFLVEINRNMKKIHLVFSFSD